MAKATKDSAVKRIVRTPMFKMRVERDRTKYSRKDKHKSAF
jgi:stalled ribosome alternative rescue factor ArfA